MTAPLDTGDATAETLSDVVYRQLRNDILLGVLEPGSRLRFNVLQGRYQVGTSPLREALTRLAAGRLVLQESNRGFRVPPIAQADFADIARVRRDLECAAIVESVRRGDDAWEERLIIADHRLRRVPRDDDAAFVSSDWESHHRAFHLALIAACGSEWTLHFCDLLHDQFDRYRRSVGTDAGSQAPIGRHHALLMKAALARDAEGAGRLLAEHIDQTARLILSFLDKRGDRPRGGRQRAVKRSSPRRRAGPAQ